MISTKSILLALVLTSYCAIAQDVPTGNEGEAANNRCVNAFKLELGKEVNGTTEGSDIDQWSETGCGVNTDIPGVWFSIIGNGNKFTARVCSLNGVMTAYSIQTRCNTDDECVGGPNRTTANCDINEVAPYEFATEDGKEYFVNVRAKLLERSNFTVSVKQSDGGSGGGDDDGSGAASTGFKFALLVVGSVIGWLSMV
mmetsp:Transcript_788/g.1876  ORF Transcript_788/g.1876 Transcript_788/m.1876 type:complete len:198 (+) Transcript_788:171-764(+)|eukprot:CAMPEP_0119552306 /NCGR_PEP_ID=MMETSP1352-20130426/5347_1 /TAXON_ID=265584 /ORGANISM="Stauroneis constricta, Strain CCMP1120" /LENGTH=197 /DNA_ID=CAMNT_0007598523 /DNA_START=150 /DNA_END=743 /DNA_ORIENTATION=+